MTISRHLNVLLYLEDQETIKGEIDVAGKMSLLSIGCHNVRMRHHNMILIVNPIVNHRYRWNLFSDLVAELLRSPSSSSFLSSFLPFFILREHQFKLHDFFIHHKRSLLVDIALEAISPVNFRFHQILVFCLRPKFP